MRREFTMLGSGSGTPTVFRQQLRPLRREFRPLYGVLASDPSNDWCTIKGYDLDSGVLLWDHKLWSPVLCTDGTVVGVRVLESTENYSHVLHSPASTGSIPARGGDTHSTSGKTSWKIVIQRIDVSDGTVTEQSPAIGWLVETSGTDPNLEAGGPLSRIAGGGTLRLPSGGIASQQYRGSDVHYLSNNTVSVPVITYFDPYSTSATLTYRLEPCGLNPTWDGSAFEAAEWTLGIPAFGGDAATTISFDWDATAAEVETALEAVGQITSATCTGGPLPGAAVTMEVEWADASLQFTSITQTDFNIGGDTVVTSATGDIAGWSYDGDTGQYRYLFDDDGNLIRYQVNDFGTVSTVFDRYAPGTAGWRKTTSPAALGVLWSNVTITDRLKAVAISEKIVVGLQHEPPASTLPSGGNEKSRLVSLQLSDGATLTDADANYRFPTNVMITDDDNTRLWLAGDAWAPVSESDTSVSDTEIGNYGFSHDDILDDWTDGLANPETSFPSGVPGVGASSTKLGFGTGLAPTGSGEVVSLDDNHYKYSVPKIGGDAIYPDSYTQYQMIPAHENVRFGTAAEFRIGLRNQFETSTIWTDWMAHTTTFAQMNTEFIAAFGEHTEPNTDPSAANVRLLFDPTLTAATGVSIPNMIWQGNSVRIMAIGGVANPQNHGLLELQYTNTGHLVIEVRGEVYQRNSSFGAMNWSDGVVAWQDNFGRAVSDGSQLFGDSAIVEANRLVVQSGTPARKTSSLALVISAEETTTPPYATSSGAATFDITIVNETGLTVNSLVLTASHTGGGSLNSPTMPTSLNPEESATVSLTYTTSGDSTDVTVTVDVTGTKQDATAVASNTLELTVETGPSEPPPPPP